jgi:hypothetical protein
MDAPATLVWIEPSPPDAEQARAMASWGRAHGVRLLAPREAAAATLTVDPRIADDVERFLDRARDAMTARDGEAVDRMLEAATSTLRAHAELPQAAWLMAEVERARSTRLRRIAPIDEGAAASAWTRAEALDGGRVAGVGEQAASAPAVAILTLPARLPAGATIRLDGSAATQEPVVTHAGLHALVVELDGNPVWASWIEAPAGTSSAQISAPLAPECSRMDVARASAASSGVDASGVRCPSWIAAIGGEPDGVRVAVCSADHCGPLVAWQAPLPWAYEPLGESGKRGHGGGGATWGNGELWEVTRVAAGGVVV